MAMKGNGEMKKIVLTSLVSFLLLFGLTANVSASEFYSANVGYQVETSAGWQDFAYGGALAGSVGEENLTRVSLHLVDAPDGASIEYRVYTSAGWSEWVDNFDRVGGESILGLQVRLANYPNANVYYQSYRKGLGWGIWVSNGKTSGKLDAAYPITGIRVQVEEVGIKYQSSSKGTDLSVRHNAETIGNGNLETLKMGLSSPIEGVSVLYRAYLKNEGWTSWAKDWEVLGSSGKTIEIIQAKLEGTDKYHIAVQAYVEGQGWWDWAYNGTSAGTVGKSLISYRVKIEKKVYVAPTVVVADPVEEFIIGGEDTLNTTVLTLDSDYSDTIDGIYDDPFGEADVDYWENYQIEIGWKIKGLTLVSFDGAGDTIQVPNTFDGTGDDAVNEEQFEVYLGTYLDGVFTVTANDDNSFNYDTISTDSNYATHTMILYDNEDPYDFDELDGDPGYLGGIVMIGVYEEDGDNGEGSWDVTVVDSVNYITWTATIAD